MALESYPDAKLMNKQGKDIEYALMDKFQPLDDDVHNFVRVSWRKEL